MCLIERLPAKIIDFPIAWCGRFVGGMPKDEAPVVAKKPRKKMARVNPTKVTRLETHDMRSPAMAMHANIEPLRGPYDGKLGRTHHAKRRLLKHRHESIRMSAARWIQS